VEVEGGLQSGEEEVLQGEDTRVAGAGGLQAREGGRHQEGGAGQEEGGALPGGEGLGRGRPPAEGATQAPHQTRTPPDRAAAKQPILCFMVPVSDV